MLEASVDQAGVGGNRAARATRAQLRKKKRYFSLRWFFVPDSNDSTPFDDLPTADLRVEATYLGGNRGTTADDPLARLLQVGNQGGFRYKGSVKDGTVRVVVLYTSGSELDWPDTLDPMTGAFTYYGDNRKPGRDLHNTTRSGNQLLKDVFEAAHGGPGDRMFVPPFLLFEKAAPGRAVRFRGLLVPGSPNLSADEDLTAIWRTKSGKRFQNYRAVFSVLDVGVVPRVWLDAIQAGVRPLESPACPGVWSDWVAGRTYRMLVAPSTVVVRKKENQIPQDPGGMEILRAIRSHFEDRPTDFEPCAVLFWRMLAPATGDCEVTRASRDGGRDAVGQYMLGPAADRVAVDFALEAKCYREDRGVNVKEVSRLIARLRHRQFGVFVTLSYFGQQAYDEIRSDGHPIVLICGQDIVTLLKERGFGDAVAVKEWLNARFPKEVN